MASVTPWLERVAHAVIQNGLMPDGGVHVWGPVDCGGHDPEDIRWWSTRQVHGWAGSITARANDSPAEDGRGSPACT